MTNPASNNPAPTNRAPSSQSHASELHVVIGAGATGTATALLLASSGARVRVVSRSGSGPRHDRIELVSTDACDVERLIELATGAHAIYNCANPPYHKWDQAWPPLAASMLEAAERTGAVLVTLSNLYGYEVNGPMRPEQPLNPPSKKGAVRAAMWHDALAAHEQGRARVVEVRASDFIGPGLGDNGHMGDRLLKRIVAGKSVQVFGASDVAHSWTAVADVARTLVAVAMEPMAWGRAWHVPSAEPQTQAEMVHALCDIAGVRPVKVGVLSPALMKVLGVFVPAIREMAEMRYQFVEPFIIDANETTEVFGIEATPLADTMRLMIEDARGADLPAPVAA